MLMIRKKLSTCDVVVNKLILFIILVITGMLAVIGYNTHLILGAIGMLFFMAVFNIFVDVPAIKAWLDDFINNRDWRMW